MAKYEIKFKQEVVREYLAGASAGGQGKEYGLGQGIIQRWLQSYRNGGLNRLRKKRSAKSRRCLHFETAAQSVDVSASIMSAVWLDCSPGRKDAQR
ncbi:helix-turn-helix domain-containing protein [Herbaspirillum camelliae]|uniref:helix-turn-helix domain-containing protein n=1 Tax=Herbaspirillum camelliae TaxID=1892903 RepID=UPI0009FB157A|nr:helix-turn-helix domain-containing protein [Herbaspirillum camelliae]